MRKTHRAFAGAFWLGSTLAVNWIVPLSPGYEPPISPAVVVAGVFIAPWFSAGRWASPDMDHRWAPGPPRNNYDWRYHRGFTHRRWFASVLSVLSVFLFLAATGPFALPRGLSLIVFAPVNGWWSHLAGDMIYGRIKVGTWRRCHNPEHAHRYEWRHRNVGLGWETGGLSETGRPSSGGSALISDPAAKVFLGLAAALAGLHLVLLVG